MPTVFLSYSREDLPLIEQLEAQLKSHPDISIWRDQEKIYGGQKWPKVLGEAVADQDMFLLAWSKHAASSHFVEFEWTTALALKKTVIPCLLDNTHLPPSLRATHALPACDFPRIMSAVTGAAHVEDVNRRTQVIGKLEQISGIKPDEVAKSAKTVFTHHQWIVLGNFYGDIHIHEQSFPPTTITEIKSLGITEAALGNFFEILGRKQVAAKELDHELRTIAHHYLDLKTRVAQLSSDDPEITKLLQNAQYAIEAVDFPRAEQLFNQASQRDEEAACNLQLVTATRLTSAAAAQAANGDVRATQLDFLKAQEYYRKALTLLPPANTDHRGQYLVKLGTALREAGVRTSGTDIWKFLDEAVAAYRTALTIFTMETSPQDWARTQNDLGRVLWAQGTRSDGEASAKLLAQAVEAYRAALMVRTKDTFPLDWAMTQKNLGIVLWDQADKSNSAVATQLLTQAIEAYRSALEVFTKNTFPQDWARTQNNLGLALTALGTHTSIENGAPFLAEAVATYRSALEVFTKEPLPQDWAKTQNNLGLALTTQGTRTGGENGAQFLTEAVLACRAALTVYLEEKPPQDWARTQNNLGLALTAQGTYTGGENGARLLEQAAQAYRAALTVRTKDKLPPQWAFTSASLTETLFASSRFIEARDQLATLLQYPNLDSELRVGSLATEVANFVALDTPQYVQRSLDTVQQVLTKQAPTFSLTGDFRLIKHVILTNQTFAKHRSWLLTFINGLENKPRDQMYTAVNTARMEFLKFSNP